MKVVYYILKRTTQVAQNHFWVNLRVQVFSFFSFWGPKALFFDPNTLDGLRNPTFGGVILLTFFDLSYGLGGRKSKYQYNHPRKSSKQLFKSKNVRSMTSQKLGFLRPNKVLGLEEIVLGPQKRKKNNFLKEGKSYNLSNT